MAKSLARAYSALNSGFTLLRSGAKLPAVPEERNMAWTTPVVTEVCIGMEVTSYESASL